MNRRNFVTSLVAAPMLANSDVWAWLTNRKTLRTIYKRMPDGSKKRVRMCELKRDDVFMFTGKEFTSQWFTAKSDAKAFPCGSWGVECL